jgi:hypothetical protein
LNDYQLVMLPVISNFDPYLTTFDYHTNEYVIKAIHFLTDIALISTGVCRTKAPLAASNQCQSANEDTVTSH